MSDASDYGVRAVILRIFPDESKKAIEHSSKSLTSTERKYSQIEKEALAIIFTEKKFHKMLYGRNFTLITDHKPLINIFGSKKGIPDYPANPFTKMGHYAVRLQFFYKIPTRQQNWSSRCVVQTHLFQSKSTSGQSHRSYIGRTWSYLGTCFHS